MDNFDIREVVAALEEAKAELTKRNYSYLQLLEFATHYVVLFNLNEQHENEIKEIRILQDNLQVQKDGNNKNKLEAMNELKKLEAQKSYIEGLKYGIDFGKKIEKKSFAKKGGNAKKAKYQPLKDFAKQLLISSGKSYPSARNASIAIESQIIAEGINLGIKFSEQQARITIYDWVRKMGLPANIIRKQARILP